MVMSPAERAATPMVSTIITSHQQPAKSVERILVHTRSQTQSIFTHWVNLQFLNQILADYLLKMLPLMSLGQYLAVYPFIMRGLYLLRQSFEPFYMNSICLLDLVRVSSPEHWDVHPTWKYMVAHTNETCEQITGIPIEEHFKNIYSAGIVEYKIFWLVLGLFTAVSFVYFLYRLFTGKVRSIIGVVACLVLAFNQGSLFHLLSHYQNDVSHINGNVMHHSNFHVDGDNAALVRTLPPGLVINFLQNYFTVMWMAYVIFSKFFPKLDKWTYLSLSSPLIMAKFILQMAYIHPFIHTQHKSWYGTFVHPWISKYVMDDYKGHVLCHHVNGYCLGDSPLYMYYYDYILYLHGIVFQNDWIRFRTLPYYLANIGLDYFLLVSVFVHLALTVLVMYPFLPQVPKKSCAPSQEVPQAKKVA
jgi:hypothetical protein